MIIENVFDRYTFDTERAVRYGFEHTDGGYMIRKPLKEDGFYVVFTVADDKMEANVFERIDGEEDAPYLPFNVKTIEGGFVGAIRAGVDALTDEIVENCFVLTDVKALLLVYVKEKYGTIPEAPWGALEEYHTLNTEKRHKWYGLFMLIPYKYLGVKKEGKIHVLNLKVEPQNIPSLIDNRHFFPSYHMNKKYWISILLDKDIDVEKVKRLLDDSYRIVEKTKQ